MGRSERSPLRVIGRVLALSLYVVWCALVVATPVFGAWLSSSLAAYRNGPIWASALIGLALFPLLPLGWEWLSTWLRRRNGVERPRMLTFWDRLTLRTLAINLAFLATVLAVYPAAGFRALSTRGDWMLEGRTGPTADAVRRQLFRLADTLEWLYRSQRDNRWREYADDDPGLRPEPNPIPLPDVPDDADSTGDASEAGDTGDTGEAAVRDTDSGTAPADSSGHGWPIPETLHPVVTAIPAEVETDPQTVARYIGEREADPFLRIKALHDYVADRIAYDAPALARGEYPPQDPETVFRTRLAVCAGYAKLFQEMAKTIGQEVVYVVGDSRTRGDSVDGVGHAWNAAKIEGRWYLIDVTWDAGHVTGGAFVKSYGTDYLLTPPEVFGLNHLPEDPAWQLVAAPISRGDFMRQPQLTPGFFRHGLRLVSPTRSQVTVDRAVEIVLTNPRGTHLLGHLVGKSDSREVADCDVSPGRDTHVRCDIPAAGTYLVQLFTGEERYGTYVMTGQIEVNRR